MNLKRPQITLRRSTRKIICLKWMTDTKSVKKPPKRPRMSPDMFGEWILILLESKSGNIKVITTILGRENDEEFL